MQLIIETQYMENYNVENPGQGQDRWKYKGGSTYKVQDVDINMDFKKYIKTHLAPKIEYESDMSQEYILDWSVVSDDYQTDFEKSQLEYEGFKGYQEPKIYIEDDKMTKIKEFESHRGRNRDVWEWFADGSDWVYNKALSFELTKKVA